MRRIITTTILLLAACGPTLEPDAIDVSKPAPARSPVGEDEGEDEGESSSGDSEGSSSGEFGTGGGSGGSEDESGSSSGGPTPAGCPLPEADSACWAVIEAAEAIGCERVGGSCWAVVAAQYFLGDAGLAQRTAACETDCSEAEAACSFVPAGVPDVSVCYMATEADCLANAAAAGIAPDDSVALTCARLATTF